MYIHTYRKACIYSCLYYTYMHQDLHLYEIVCRGISVDIPERVCVSHDTKYGIILVFPCAPQVVKLRYFIASNNKFCKFVGQFTQRHVTKC